jgi:hypothetical protein
MSAEARELAIVAVIAIAPLAVVLLVALLRSYNITLHMRRHNRDKE